MTKAKKYWKGLAELTNDPAIDSLKQNEFVEKLPVDEFLGDEKLAESNTSRRDFLKFLGFSTAAATLASCETPVNKAIPYVVKPEEITPGVANWYASTYYDGNDFANILVKTREGRPVFIKGNGGSNHNLRRSSLNVSHLRHDGCSTINSLSLNIRQVLSEQC